MQEIMKDGSEGEEHIADTIEDLVPHIKKSLEDPKVKYVKVFKTVKTVIMQHPTEAEVFVAEEKKEKAIPYVKKL